MEADLYVYILEYVMKPYAVWKVPLKWVFQNDNGPKHTSRAVNRGFLTMVLMLWISLLSQKILIPLKICEPTSRQQFLQQNRKTNRNYGMW